MGEEQMENVSIPVNPQIPSPAPEHTPETSLPKDNENPSDPSPKAEMNKQNDLERKLLMVLAVTSGLSIFLWFMVGVGYPWFIYVIYAAALVDAIVYGYKQKNGFFVNISIYATTNIMLFLCFLAGGGGYPWFIFPAFSMAIMPASQYIYKKFPSPLRWLYIHAAIYILINSMLFFTWMVDSLHNPFPWFIYPWCGWGVALLIQYNYVVMKNKSKLFILVVGDIGLMLTITFRFAVGPLFMVFVLIGAILIAIYYIFMKKGYTMHFGCMKKTPSSPSPSTPQDPQIGVVISPNGINMTAGGQVTNPFSHTYAYNGQPPMNDYNSAPRQYISYPPPMYYQSSPLPPSSLPSSSLPPSSVPPPLYYAYYASGNGQQQQQQQQQQHIPLYPPIPPATASVPIPSPPSSLSPSIPSPAPANDAVLTSVEEKEKKENEEEEGYLLRNSPTRSYSSK